MLQLALRQACIFPKKNGTNALFRNGLLGETWSRGIVQMEHLIAEMLLIIHLHYKACQ